MVDSERLGDHPRNGHGSRYGRGHIYPGNSIERSGHEGRNEMGNGNRNSLNPRARSFFVSPLPLETS